MKNTPLVSIIIPVYNVERYLADCITSILTQDLSSFECIMVDDGSTDNSPNLCDEFAIKDNRIRVIHKKNGGLSDARNTGLNNAVGKYIMFIDSDDFWIDTFVLGNLVNLFEMHYGTYDFIQFNCKYYYQKNNIYKLWKAYSKEVIDGNNKKEKIIGLITHGQFPMSACFKIIKHDFLKKENIKFINNIYCEDIPWFLELIYKSNNFMFINEYYYVYRQQVHNSITSTFSEKKYRDLYNILVSEIENIKKNYPDIEIQNALFSFMAYEYSMLMGKVHFFPFKNQSEEIKKLKEYLWLLKYTMHPKVKIVASVLKYAGFNFTSYLLYLKLKFSFL